jgi:hypothetical protein
MPLIDLTIQHGRTLEEARARLETAVHEITGQFHTLVRRVEWAADRERVTIQGVGFWVEMRVDARVVHVTADAPILGGLLGGQAASRLKQIVQETFQKQLP